MHWLATTYKRQQEAAKTAGLITSYRVMVVEARTAQDPDIYLVTEYKNWAALEPSRRQVRPGQRPGRRLGREGCSV